MSKGLFAGRFLRKRDEDLLLQGCVLVTPNIMWIQAAVLNWYLMALYLWFTLLSMKTLFGCKRCSYTLQEYSNHFR